MGYPEPDVAFEARNLQRSTSFDSLYIEGPKLQLTGRFAVPAPVPARRSLDGVSSACGQPLPLPCCSRALWQVLSLNNSTEPPDARTSALAVLQRN